MKKKIAIVLLLLLTLCGCTKRFTVEGTDGDKKTTKSYVSNIICKPEEDDSVKIYVENKDKLVSDYDKLQMLKDSNERYNNTFVSLASLMELEKTKKM